MQVTIRRNVYFMGGLMPLTIYQNGQAIGKIDTNETKAFEVVEGSTLVAKQLGVRSNPVEVQTGDHLEISGKPWLGIIQILALLSLFFVSAIPSYNLRIISYLILPLIYFSSLFLIENYKLEKKEK
ncbi:hypothetical protein [Facklamia miroungae]|uniref:Uncharacterized protein n=1 Tax=Facklamia miroungae TaxID=120956 RepID=A0A1G7UWN4_9LACT|nr:hypothetical protein [Facklamia miroungae]NKZ30152.1 hypothetical protein [Facklamia miroungae]SDG51907.1 hypothetical protein SAMN05421791_11239 [Facklamia miroungae]